MQLKKDTFERVRDTLLKNNIFNSDKAFFSENTWIFEGGICTPRNYGGNFPRVEELVGGVSEGIGTFYRTFFGTYLDPRERNLPIFLLNPDIQDSLRGFSEGINKQANLEVEDRSKNLPRDFYEGLQFSYFCLKPLEIIALKEKGDVKKSTHDKWNVVLLRNPEDGGFGYVNERFIKEKDGEKRVVSSKQPYF